MFTTTVSTSVTTNLDFNYVSNKTYEASAKLSINETIPTGTTNVPVNFSFSTGSGVLLALSTNIALYPLVIKTNSTVSPNNTFSLIANQSNIFVKNDNTFSLTADASGSPLKDINTLYVSNTGTLPASLRVDSLFDITPGI
jgi:hypothetical protein